MASGSFGITVSGSYVAGTVYWSSSNNGAAANTSTVTVTIKLSRTNSGYTTTGHWTGKITCDSQSTTGGGTGTQNITQNSNTTIASATFYNIPHEADGSRWITISVDGDFYSRDINGSGNVTLDKIPRGPSSCTLSTTTNYLNTNNTFTVSYTTYTTFTYKLRLSIPNVIAIVTTDGISQSAGSRSQTYTFSVSQIIETILPKVTSANTVVIGAVIETYSGSTIVCESSEAKVTLTIPDALADGTSLLPTVTPGLTYVNGGEPWTSTYIAGYSKATLSLSGSGKYGATIKSTKITNNGEVETLSGTTSINNTTVGPFSAKTITFTYTLTDTRGKTNSTTKQITVYNYTAPSLTLSGYRCDSTGAAKADGTYVKVNASYSLCAVGSNKVTVRKIVVNGVTTNMSSTSYSGVLGAGALDTKKEYTVTLTVTDDWKTSTKSFVLSARAIMVNLLPTKYIGLGAYANSAHVVTLNENSIGDPNGKQIVLCTVSDTY